jgi:hypothetical protein
MEEMKKLRISMVYSMVGDVFIEVPDEFTLEQAVMFANDHVDNISLPDNADYLVDSDSFDEETAEFVEE